MEIKHITLKENQHRKQFNQQNKNQNNNKQVPATDVAFTGAIGTLTAIPSVFLRFLDTNQAWGANLVDIGSMVVPRTYYDTKHRGLATGLETGRRESTGTFNHAMVGVYGTAAGAALAMGLNRAYQFKAHKIFANNDTLNILGDSWYNVLKTGGEKPVDEFLKNVVSNIKVFNPSRQDAVEGFVSISEDTQKTVISKLKDLIENGTRETISDKDRDYIKALITANTGGEKSAVLNGFYNGQKAQADNTLSTLIENIHNVSKAFNKENVIKDFKDAAQKTIEDVKILKSLKRLNISRSVAGLGFASLFGMSVQPINMYLTKKNTGCDGFPGVPGRNKDKSKSFLATKAAMAGIFGVGALSTIMVGDKSSAVKASGLMNQLKQFGTRFLSKIQFKGMMPTVNQLKFVYGMTIMSRLMCARDKNELRESVVKDSLGFLNLLVLGSLVTKGVTRLLNKSLINMQEGTNKGFINWLKNSSVKSRDEVMLETLKNNGIEVVKDGKVLSYTKLLEASKALPKEVKSILRGRLAALNIAQLVGYAYSGIFLGYYLPKINDKMSKANEEKRIAKLAQAQGKTIEQVKAEMAEEIKRMEAKASGKTISEKQNLNTTLSDNGTKTILSDSNKTFLNKHMAA